MPGPAFYNSCWMLACRREARAYRRDSCRVQQTQERLLQAAVSQNADTWFGRRHRFESIVSASDFRKEVPLSTYADYMEPVERISHGESSVLTAEPVVLFEPTSGSTSAEKLIPYTLGLKRSFQRAIRTWIWDLFSNRPQVRQGFAYWSISPLANVGRVSPAGIPIGFDDDAGYLGTFEQRLLAKAIAVPTDVARCQSVRAAQYATLFFLLRCQSLSLVSVWSPTFLTELLDQLQTNWEPLCDDVERGRLSAEFSRDLSKTLIQQFEELPDRANHVRNVLARPRLDADWVKQLWPQLSLVSCWADGPSSAFARNLRMAVPGIEVQPKGLLATEAFVSIPLIERDSSSLAIRSHFFEFQPVNSGGATIGQETLLAYELTVGAHYRIVVTTAGGLYRYQMMDQVEVIDFNQQIPVLRFVGKADSVSDLVGEKLNAAHVQSVLELQFDKLQLTPYYFELAAQLGDQPFYELRVSDDRLLADEATQSRLCGGVDAALQDNPGYRYAREAGQLGQLRIALRNRQQADVIVSRQKKRSVVFGSRYGSVKPPVLHPIVGDQ